MPESELDHALLLRLITAYVVGGDSPWLSLLGVSTLSIAFRRQSQFQSCYRLYSE